MGSCPQITAVTGALALYVLGRNIPIGLHSIILTHFFHELFNSESLTCRSGVTVAVVGGGGGGPGSADGRASGVHAQLPQEAHQTGEGAAGGEGPPVAEGGTL